MTPKILFAGGGTAGHVEPALAVANWLRNEKPNWNYVFVGTKKGLENQLVPAAGFDLIHISKVVLPRQFTPEIFILPIKVLTATWQAIKICKKVDLVVGFGGYACPPIYIAAALLRKPIFIHEANAVPGWANRLGAPFASQIFIAFSRAGQKLGRWRTAKLSGMPIRAEIIASANLSNEEAKTKKRLQIEKWELAQDKPYLSLVVLKVQDILMKQYFNPYLLLLKKVYKSSIQLVEITHCQLQLRTIYLFHILRICHPHTMLQI